MSSAEHTQAAGTRVRAVTVRGLRISTPAARGALSTRSPSVSEDAVANGNLIFRGIVSY